MLYRDHFGGEPGTQDYAPAPRFSIVRENRAERLTYEALQHVETMRIAAQRLDRVADDLARQSATDEALESLKNAARDCEMALAAAIAKLCGEAA
jgi:hypothetical protein